MGDLAQPAPPVDHLILAMRSAIEAGDSGAVESLMGQDERLAHDCKCRDEAYSPELEPLMLAARNGRADCLKALLTASDWALRYVLNEAMLAAATEGHATCVQLLLPRCDPNRVDLRGRTPLMSTLDASGPIACPDGRDRAACVEILLPATDLPKVDTRGNNALAHAVASGQAALVEKLLAKTPEAQARSANCAGQTPFHLAAQLPAADCLRLLLPHSDVNAATRSVGGRAELTPLMLAAEKGRGDCVELLVRHGADATAATAHGLTALSYAALAGDPQCVAALLDGSDLEQRAYGQKTPLMLAAKEGHAKCVGLLLEAGADPRARASHGETALMIAVDHPDCVRALIPVSDVRALTENNVSALLLAAQAGNLESARLLIPLSNPAQADTLGRTPLMVAGLRRAPEILEALLPGSNACAIDQSGRSALAHVEKSIIARHNTHRCLDVLAPFSNPVEVARLFKEAGPEKMPRWAAHLEKTALAEVVKRVDPHAGANHTAIAPAQPAKRNVMRI